MNDTQELAEDTLKPIDLRKVFESKNPKLARWMPRFVFNWLKKSFVWTISTILLSNTVTEKTLILLMPSWSTSTFRLIYNMSKTYLLPTDVTYSYPITARRTGRNCPDFIFRFQVSETEISGK